MLQFLRQNRRWIGAGFLLTLFSSFGQTWFISLFAIGIKENAGLSDGDWGSLYTLATLCSAALMFWRGSLADTVPLSRLAPAMALLFAGAAFGLSISESVLTVGISLFLLRFCGQGMFSHIAMTAMGRWFCETRGRAVAISNLGHQAGEVILPLFAILAISLIGWRSAWVGVSLVLLVVVAPVLWLLLKDDRAPVGHPTSRTPSGLYDRHWTRRDAFSHWLFPAILPVLLTPGFIGTVIFFHQAHIAEVKGWSLLQMAPGYTFYAASTVCAAVASGWAADKLGVVRLLPLLLVPMGMGSVILWAVEPVWGWYVSLAVTGITQGMGSAFWGVFLPVAYGTRHLGSLRSLATTVMVISTAIGPGITGLLIDRGINFPQQSLFLGGWCMLLTGHCCFVALKYSRERNLSLQLSTN